MAKAKCNGGAATWEGGTEVPHSKDLSPNLAGDTPIKCQFTCGNESVASGCEPADPGARVW